MRRRSSGSSLRWLAVVAVASAAMTGCSSDTKTTIDVLIKVDSGFLPSKVTTIHGSIAAPGRSTVAVDLPAVSSQEWIINPQNVSKPFTALITITGQLKADGGAATNVISSQAYVSIVSGLYQKLEIDLSTSCQNVTCPTDQTCAAGACVPIPTSGPDGGVSSTGGSVGAGGSATGGRGGAAGAGGLGGKGGSGGSGTGGAAGSGTGGAAGAGQGGTGGKPRLNPGDPCTATSDCASGVCSSADKVCCDSDCAGTCQSCVGSKTGKTNGACNPLPAGSNADNDCSASTDTCGTTGSCDGTGKCAVAAATMPCTGTSACSAGQLTVTPATCDGKGACVLGSPATSACPGGVACMSTSACLPSSCTTDNNCNTGSFCDPSSHTCTAKRDLGGTCSGGTQCTSGFCADGVCCNNACDGTCEACVQSKTGVASGHCAAVSSGTDPDNECSSDGTTCGHTGACDHNGGSGGGACAYTSSGTSCAGTFSCSGSGNTSRTTGSCDGAGTCKQSAAMAGSCAPYTCASSTACATSCAANSDCTSGSSCISGACTANAFKTGPCVTTADLNSAVVYVMGNDGKIHSKSTDATGKNWGSWSTLSLDASKLDARSDLDCSANSSVTHITATGSTPLGAFMHAQGSGTTFNPFARELSEVFDPPGASIKAYPQGNGYLIGGLSSGIPDLYDVQGSTYTSLQPDTTLVSVQTSAIDISQVSGGGGAARVFAGFDNGGKLQIYTNFISSAPMMWAAPVTISPPSGTTFQYSPSICVDTGAMGGSQVHVQAVASGQLYETWADNSTQGPFAEWQRLSDASGPPDCTMMGDESLHIVTLTSAGHVLDIRGGTSVGVWGLTDLGTF
jgi:hypothetical protein